MSLELLSLVLYSFFFFLSYKKLNLIKIQFYLIVIKPTIISVADSKVYLLSDVAAYAYQPFGSSFLIYERYTVNELLNSKKTSVQFPPIRAAFDIPIPGSKGHILTLG